MFFSIGRFNVPQAGIIAHDGGELGYRVTRALRLSVFGGLAAEGFYDPLDVKSEVGDDLDKTQGGIYLTYNQKRSALFDSIYATAAVAKKPSSPDLVNEVSRVNFHHLALIHIAAKHRLDTFLDLDLSPDTAVRRFRLAYDFGTPYFRTRLALYQVAAEDYPTKREWNYDLEPSGERTLSLDLQGLIGRHWAPKLEITQTTRQVDGLKRQDLLGGLLIRGLLSRALSLKILAGKRKNFLSDGTLIKLGANYFNEHFAFYINQSFAKEDYRQTNEAINPSTTQLHGDIYLRENIRGGLGFSLTKDKKQTSTAFLVTIGVRFGNQSTSPVRTEPADFESF